MNYYENPVILDETLPEDGIRAAVDRIKSVIEEAGGQIIRIDNWGTRRLAYEINKRKRGYYALFVFKAPATAIKRLEELYKVFDPVMKFIVIRLGKPEIKALEASLQAQAAQAAQAQAAAAAAEAATAAPAPQTGEAKA